MHKCEFCGNEIDGTKELDGIPMTYKVGDVTKTAHEDCYYEALGNIVEQHPFVSPPRGHGSSNLD